MSTTQVLSGLKDLLIHREKSYAPSTNGKSTATGNASAINKWADSGFSTTLIDGSADDGDYYVDHYLCPISGTAANLGDVRKITSWAAGEFTVASDFSSIPQSADVAMVVKFMRSKVSTARKVREKLPREYQSRTFEMPSMINGKPSGEINFTTEWIDDNDSPLHELLLSSMGAQLQTADTSAIVVSGAVGLLRITDTESSKFEVGGIIGVLLDDGTYNMAAVTAKDATPVGYDTLTIFPDIATYPTAGKTVKAFRCYTTAECDLASVTIICLDNAQRRTFIGCRGTVKCTLNNAGIPELEWEFKADDVTVEDSTTPFNVEHSSVEPPANFTGDVDISSTAYAAIECGFDAGIAITAKGIFDASDGTGRTAWDQTDRKMTGSCKIFNEASAEFGLHDNNTTITLLAMMGTPANAAGSVGFWLPKSKSDDMPDGDEEGRQTYDLSLAPFDNNTDADNADRLVLGFSS